MPQSILYDNTKIAVAAIPDEGLGAAINDRLAKERADTVRQYIERTMKIPGRLTSEGRSFKELVKTGCERVATARAIACNQPNRRVVAEITGVKR